MEKEKTVLNNNKNILQTIFHIIMGFLISVFSQILRIVIIDRTYFLTRLNEGLFTFLTFIHYFYFFYLFSGMRYAGIKSADVI